MTAWIVHRAVRHFYLLFVLALPCSTFHCIPARAGHLFAERVLLIISCRIFLSRGAFGNFEILLPPPRPPTTTVTMETLFMPNCCCCCYCNIMCSTCGKVQSLFFAKTRTHQLRQGEAPEKLLHQLHSRDAGFFAHLVLLFKCAYALCY